VDPTLSQVHPVHTLAYFFQNLNIKINDQLDTDTTFCDFWVKFYFIYNSLRSHLQEMNTELWLGNFMGIEHLGDPGIDEMDLMRNVL
jgi:hypothetical protein